MRERKGDWRDVLSAYTLALDAKKLYMGFVATLLTVLVMVFSAMLYGALVMKGGVANLGNLAAEKHIFQHWLEGNIGALTTFLPVLNPFAGGFGHFWTSILFYVLLLAVWSFMGGVISRIAALEYGRDELPTLSDGIDMAKKKYTAYFFAPLSPLIGIVFFTLMNALGGLIGSIPYVGPILMIFGIVPWFISTVIIVFIVVLGIISFCMMYPAISIGGKDAFEGWSSAYSYVLWGFNRFVGYSVLAVVIGIVSTIAAWALCEFFIYALLQTLHYGFLGTSQWVPYMAFGGPFYNTQLLMPEGSVLMEVSGVFMLVALLCVRAIPFAYLFSYFFSSGTIICFLMRKHVDRIEIDEVYEEEEEEEFGEMPEEPETPVGGAEEEEEGAEAETAEEPAAESTAQEEEEEEAEGEAEEEAGEEGGPEEAPEEKKMEEEGEEEDAGEEEEKGTG